MVFSRFQLRINGLVVFCFIVTFCAGCSQQKKNTVNNTFYIELVNFSNDSLKQKLAKNIFGKGTYYNKDNQLEIISLNYATDNLPEMHYFMNADELSNDIKINTRKIRIEFKDIFSFDSIRYTLQKFKYSGKEWLKISDLGVLKETKKFVQPVNILDEYIQRIVLNTVEYSYN